MIDEMYLQKSAQYQSGENEGVDKEGNLYKGTVYTFCCSNHSGSHS